MKKFIVMILISIMSIGFSSCIISEDTTYTDYQKVYFDRVIFGHVISNSYVFDGTYSYHILGTIPTDIYWELCPLSLNLYVYTPNMIRLSLFEYTRRPIFFNRRYERYYDFNRNHQPIIMRQNKDMRPGLIPDRRGNERVGDVQKNKPDLNNRKMVSKVIENRNTQQPNVINHNIGGNTINRSMQPNMNNRTIGGSTRSGGSIGGGSRGGFTGAGRR